MAFKQTGKGWDEEAVWSNSINRKPITILLGKLWGRFVEGKEKKNYDEGFLFSRWNTNTIQLLSLRKYHQRTSNSSYAFGRVLKMKNNYRSSTRIMMCWVGLDLLQLCDLYEVKNRIIWARGSRLNRCFIVVELIIPPGKRSTPNLYQASHGEKHDYLSTVIIG